MDKLLMHVGVGDTFTYKKEHWMIIDVRANVYVCKNKDTSAVVEFEKDIVNKIING